MKTIDEMIAVMQAYKDGKEIESRPYMPCSEWHYSETPKWDWSCVDYRVKPEPEYVPYDSAMEVEKDKWVRLKSDHYFTLRRITIINRVENWVYIEKDCYSSMKELFNNYVYEDGTPCGKLKEETINENM